MLIILFEDLVKSEEIFCFFGLLKKHALTGSRPRAFPISLFLFTGPNMYLKALTVS